MARIALSRRQNWIRQHFYVGVLRSPHLRRLYLGLFLSSIGDGVAVVSVPWLALEVAGSVNRALAVAAAGTAAFLPGIPVGFFAGVRRWRVGRRPILLPFFPPPGGLLRPLRALARLHPPG